MGKKSATNCSKSKKWVRPYQISQLFFGLCHLINTKLNFFEAILFKFKSCLNRTLSMKTIYLWPKISQKVRKINKIVCYVPSNNFKTYWKISASNKLFLDLCQWTQIKTNVVPWQPINDNCYTKSEENAAVVGETVL